MTDRSQAAAFDTAVVTVADRALAESGVDIDNVEIERRCVYALVLHDAWQFNSIPALIQHLSEVNSVADQLGFQSIPHKNWFYKRMKQCEIAENAVTEAAKRAVFAVWRNGYVVPDEVMTTWGLEDTAVTADYSVSQATRRRALKNWGRTLLSDAEAALTFNRAQNAQYSLTQFLGLCAHSALQNVGLTSSPNTAHWLYDSGTVPDGSGLLKHIQSLSVDEIESQFADVHRQVFQRYRRHGLFDASIDVAYDTVKIQSWTPFPSATIGQYKPGSDTVPKWTFVVSLSVTKESRVCFGVTLVTDKSQYDTAVTQLLNQTPEYVDIGYAIADKEFYRGSVIDTLRRRVDQRWFIKAQERKPILELAKAAEKGQSAFRRNVDATSATPCPNAVAVPNTSDETQALASFPDLVADGNTSYHTVYLTGLPEHRVTPELVDETYGNRWSIETAMRQFQHGMLPCCGSRKSPVRLYLANVAMLFFNWHALINRVPSPQYALPLDVTHHELLTAIRHVAFTDSQRQGD